MPVTELEQEQEMMKPKIETGSLGLQCNTLTTGLLQIVKYSVFVSFMRM